MKSSRQQWRLDHQQTERLEPSARYPLLAGSADEATRCITAGREGKTSIGWAISCCGRVAFAEERSRQTMDKLRQHGAVVTSEGTVVNSPRANTSFL